MSPCPTTSKPQHQRANIADILESEAQNGQSQLTTTETPAQQSDSSPAPLLLMNTETEETCYEACSWQDVLDSMETAAAQYGAKTESNRLRALPRNKAIAVTLESMTDMIPEESGLGVLRGGLKTIFKLINRRIDNSERILNAFEDIPITFMSACLALRTHRDDQLLRQYVQGLFDILSEEIPEMQRILLRKHEASLPRRFFKQHPEAEKTRLDTSLDNITRAARRVSSRAEALRDDVAVETLHETQGARTEAQAGFGRILEGIDSVRLAHAERERRELDRYEQQEREMLEFFERVHGDMTRRLEDYHAEFGTGLSGLRDELQGLVAVVQGPEVAEPSGKFLQVPQPHYLLAAPPISYQPPPYHLVTLDEIYMLLSIERPYFLAEDLTLVARAAHAMSQAALGRAAWLLNVDRFRQWVDVTEHPSELILVNGHMGSLCKGKLSPLSVLAATLASMRQVSPDLVILSHFCGLHASPGDDLAGPRGMLRAIVSQAVLLLKDRHCANPGVAVAADEALLNGIAQRDVESLCEVLEALLGQLGPQVAVFCVLDNVSEYETSLRGWDDELCNVVGRLRQMTERMRWGPRLKVLLTAGNRSITVVWYDLRE
ncbi:hypothetical protein F5X68DRAFT_261159 [Plectosphaerella plurivora]|uniref:Nephrocystin 3-like N-terminal domain-containing protein n=1 Tax=Plectosphaerella plurivora TaxID=936078 RepID=A0A9P8VCK8_9PEZI|nr:hypothetical protein F5X68DRAFT_261159 [Plectosphaerella plurivora]